MAHVALLTATVEDLFNLPLYEHHLVIDTRHPDEYSHGHIATAVSIPSPPLESAEGERERSLVQFIVSYIKEFVRPENPSPIVLYGSSHPECVKHTEWLAKKLEKLQQDRKAVAIVQPATDTSESTPENPFEQFCNTIADRAKEIWILKGGYDAFCAEYPFLCGNVSFESMFPLPHQISSNLFLGSRVVSLTREVLSKLRITHLIVASSKNLEWSELQGVSVLQCDVEDKNDQDMFPCWRACISFIDEALRNQASAERVVKVLVLLHGRSRSTSVILAFLIKNLSIRFEEAWSMVRSKCWHLIDRSLVYENQLKDWERCENSTLKME